MAVAFRTLAEGTKRNLSRTYLLKNVLCARINYKYSSALLGDNNNFTRTPVNGKTYIESSQLRHFHRSGLQKAELVKFHLSDIGMLIV